MSKNRLIVKGNNLCVLLREVIGSSLTALSGNLFFFFNFQQQYGVFFNAFLKPKILINKHSLKDGLT